MEAVVQLDGCGAIKGVREPHSFLKVFMQMNKYIMERMDQDSQSVPGGLV